MKRLRTAVFWLHLAAGVTAGLVILVMSVTGALLALKPQILNAIDKDVRFVTPPEEGSRLGVHAIVASVQRERPGARPATVTLQADPGVGRGRPRPRRHDLRRSLFRPRARRGIDARADVVPDGGRLAPVARRVRRQSRDRARRHRRQQPRLLPARGDRSVPVVAALVVLVERPRHHLVSAARNGRARDFNWHNVIGLWCAPVLIVLTITGVVMSYPWANALLFRLAGSPAPVSNAGAGAPGGGSRGDDAPPAPLPDNLDALWSRAEEQVPAWRTITARLPARAGAPAAFTIVDGRSWNAFARSQLTVDVATASVSKWEPYEASSRGQKWRGWVRFGHTGELGGVPGQIVAGLASAGGAVLVWTGLALAFRRLLAWRRSWSRAIESASTTGARSLSSAGR